MALSRSERETLIARYAEGPTRLKAALASVPVAAMQWRPKAGEWSAHEVICHCADSETNAYARIRFLMTEKEPVIQGYDESQWAITLDYHAHPIAPALAVVEAVRANTVALIRRLPDEAWTRVGRHTQSGTYGAEDWLRIYAEHLEGHARQIEDNVRQWRATSGS
ncbi:MAG TPA: DinB family protein [Methylomirabilota bacterium]|nr:DinB family protein [Methylomirabilota bacterium]